MTTTPDDWSPLEESEHRAQIDALLKLLAPAPKRIVDLAAGAGRVAAPLRDAGHDVVAIDSDPRAVSACAALGLETRRADALDAALDLTVRGARPDAVLCLGHTFMLFHEPLRAAALLRTICAALAPHGAFVIDNFPASLWTDVHEGAWAEGVSEDGQMQILWRPADNVFALRHAREVNDADWTIRLSDRLHRLWSAGELALLAALAATEPPREDSTGLLLVFRTPG